MINPAKILVYYTQYPTTMKLKSLAIRKRRKESKIIPVIKKRKKFVGATLFLQSLNYDIS
jgi:hypothetical protein